MEKKITFDVIKKEAKNVTGMNEKDPYFKTAAILLSAVSVGPNIKKISSFTGYSRNEVGEKIKKARENGIITKGNKFAVEWFEKDYGGIAFCCDCMVIDGLLERK